MSHINPNDIFQIGQYHQRISSLHAYLHNAGRFPHLGQFPVLRAFFQDRKKVIMGQCGRSHGKSEEILYITWRFAVTNPGSEIYIICPEIKQAKKIYWLPKRLQSYGPREFVEDIRESELRVIFDNGSTIMLDGCENFDSLRGIKPRLVVYDEFQHHTKDFDEEVMQPNLASGKVSLVVMGTPPKRVCYYTDFREHLLDDIANGDTSKFYVELPTEANPTMDRLWLANKRQELIKRNRYNVWLREYEGKLAFDTESAIFPFFDDKLNGKHVKPHRVVMDMVYRDRKKLNFYAIFDPGTATVFAVLFAAVNPYTNQIFIIDEIYATSKEEMNASAIWRTAKAKMEEICDYEERWNLYYDEAAAWFPNEIGQGLIPTSKLQYSKLRMADEGRPGESVLNTIMEDKNKFVVSEGAKKFIWEMINYVVNEKGEYPRRDDHLMDGLFYFVQEARIIAKPLTDMTDEERAKANAKILRPQDLLRTNQKKDFAESIEVDFYDDCETGDIWEH